MRTPNFSSCHSGVCSLIYCFDLDGTICTNVANSMYEDALPDPVMVNEINRLYESDHTIKIMTARGSVSGIDHTELTKRQLSDWGVKYNELIMNKKPYADIYIDDRAIHIDDWKRKINPKKGIIAGAFDIIHAGYALMFKQAGERCDYLTIALHSDPSMENGKMKPVNSVEDRRAVLLAMKYVDDVILYHTEQELHSLLASGEYDIRFLGEDYLGKTYTGPELPIEIEWVSRSHNYSTTALKRKIADEYKN